MKSTLLATSLAALSPQIILADFSGSDSMAAKSSKWEDFSNSGGARTLFQNSRLEYLVKSPTSEDRSILRWTRNEGAYDQNWFIQVDVHLDTVALNNGSHVNLNLGVVRSDQRSQGYFIAIDRYRTEGSKTSYVSGFESGPANADELDHADSTAVAGTLRIHFDSAAETLTGSWNAGGGWKYFAPEDIGDWGMTDADSFTAILAAAGGGNDQGSGSGPVIKSGEAFFTNFKTGSARPDIAVEQPAGSELTDGRTKKSFGTVAVGGGTAIKILTIRNTGTAKLKNLSISKSGTHAADFTVTAPARTSLPPGAATTFKVTFDPKAAGTRIAAIRIGSNDPDENPFDVTLTGMGAP